MNTIKRCPKCNSENIHSINGLSGTGGNYVIDSMKCDHCESEWDNFYTKEDDGIYTDESFKFTDEHRTDVVSETETIYAFDEYRM